MIVETFLTPKVSAAEVAGYSNPGGYTGDSLYRH